MDNSRRRFLSLAALGVVALAGPHRAIAYDDGDGFRLGRIWQVREYEPDGSVWVGTWARRGNSPVFDAQWRNTVTGGVAQDVIEFRGVQDGSVVLYRHRHAGTYYGHISRDGSRIWRGSASWYGPGNSWEAQIVD